MAILGADIPADLIEKTRDALLRGINKSETLRINFPHTKLTLHRKTYSGDYILRGHSAVRGFFDIAKFGMLPMPGCKGICIFHHVEVEREFRGNGIGLALLRIRQQAARDAGYSLAMATVKYDNTTERNILGTENWTFESTFHNKRTSNWVVIYQKNL